MKQKPAGRIPRDAPANFLGHACLFYGASTGRLVDDGILLKGNAAANDRSGPSPLRKLLAGSMPGNTWFTRHVVPNRWFLRTGQAVMCG